MKTSTPNLKERIVDVYRILKHVVLFYSYTMRGLFCRQRLVVPNEQLICKRKYRFSKSRQLKWFKLYNASPDTPHLNFSYYSPVVVRSFLLLMNKLHINYKNLLHLQYDETCLDRDGIQPNKTYIVKSLLVEIVKLRSTTLALRITTVITDKQGKVYLKANNLVFVKGITAEDLEALNRSSFYGNVEDRALIKLALKKTTLTEGAEPAAKFDIPKRMGIRYGLVSGDMNFIHTTKFFAKLFGFKDLFIQGMCTVNYLTQHYLGQTEGKLNRVKVTFTNPIYENQTISLWHQGNQFEITDAQQKLVAYGEVG